MIGSALKLITGQRSWIPLAAMTALMLAACAWAYTQGCASMRLGPMPPTNPGRAGGPRRHARTTSHGPERDRARQSALELARNATATMQDSLRDALAREAEAVSAAVARKRILDDMRTRIRNR
jgi:hypothetical protein